MAATWAATPDDAVASIESGQTVALGGFLSMRHPMALVRALLRRGVRDLTIVAPAGGIDADLMIAAGAVRRIVFGVCSLDLVGPAPAFRRAAEAGRLEAVDFGVSALGRALEAGWRGLPEQPARYLIGSDLKNHHPARPHPERRDLVNLPALRPDVCLIHADRVSRDGDARFKAAGLDLYLAWASDRVIVSAERVVDRDRLAAYDGAVLARDHVHVVVEAPWGAHPTSCPTDYAADVDYALDYRDHIAGAADQGLAARDYYDGDEAGHRAAMGVATVLELRRLAESGGMLGWTAPSTN